MWRLALAAVFFVAVGAASETTVVFDPARTSVEFSLGDVLHTVHGVFKLKNGVIHFNPANGNASGLVVIDAASGNSDNGVRDHRMNKNILETDRYAEITFTPDRVSGDVVLSGSCQVQVHGQFRIHGTDHEMTLPFQLQADAGQLTAATHFPVPYVKWGMKNPSTFMLKVNETVDINIHAAGRFTPSNP